MRRLFLVIIPIIIYRILLDYNYTRIISPIFEYVGMTLDATHFQYSISWLLLTILTLLFIPVFKHTDEFWSLIAIMLYFFTIVPLTSLIAFKALPFDFILSQCLFWVLMILLLRYLKPPIKYWKQNTKPKLINITTIILITCVVVVSGIYTSFRLNFSLNDIYDLRLEAREYSMPTLLLYLWSATGKLLPFLFVYYMQKGKRIILYIIAFTIVLNFGINGSKSTLFLLPFCVILSFFYKRKYVDYIAYAFSALCAVSILEYLIFDTAIIATLFIRRMLFIPSLLDYCYFDYINIYGPTYFGEEMSMTIGDIYFGKEEMRCNNGGFTDAFQNLGYLGLFVYPFIYALYIKFFSYSFRGVNPALLFFAAYLFSRATMSSLFTTSLLTHGMFLLCLLLLIMPKTYLKIDGKY